MSSCKTPGLLGYIFKVILCITKYLAKHSSVSNPSHLIVMFLQFKADILTIKKDGNSVYAYTNKMQSYHLVLLQTLCSFLTLQCSIWCGLSHVTDSSHSREATLMVSNTRNGHLNHQNLSPSVTSH